MTHSGHTAGSHALLKHAGQCDLAQGSKVSKLGQKNAPKFPSGDVRLKIFVFGSPEVSPHTILPKAAASHIFIFLLVIQMGAVRQLH